MPIDCSQELRLEGNILGPCHTKPLCAKWAFNNYQENPQNALKEKILVLQGAEMSKRDGGGSTENNLKGKLYFYLLTFLKAIFILPINNLSPRNMQISTTMFLLHFQSNAVHN